MALLLSLLIPSTLRSQSKKNPLKSRGVLTTAHKGLQEISITGSVFGPLILPGDLGDWELDPVINRSGIINLRYPKNTIKLGYHRQNIFGQGVMAGIYNHKYKLGITVLNYDKGGPMISVHKTITIFKKKHK